MEERGQAHLSNPELIKVEVMITAGRASSKVDSEIMAIGWGKSYEEQMEEASQRASTERIPRVPLEERARLQRIESLKLSRSRIEDQLSKAVRPAHRQMLMKALQAIEEEAEEIAQTPSKKNEPRR